MYAQQAAFIRELLQDLDLSAEVKARSLVGRRTFSICQ